MAAIFALSPTPCGGDVHALKASPATNEMAWPESSSITTKPGSASEGLASTTRSLAHRPMAASASSDSEFRDYSGTGRTRREWPQPLRRRARRQPRSPRFPARAADSRRPSWWRWPATGLAGRAQFSWSSRLGWRDSGASSPSSSKIGSETTYCSVAQFAKIEQAAAFAAKREVGVGRGVDRFAANWALIFHGGGAALDWIRWRSDG